MPKPLGDFDPKATYDAAARRYVDVARVHWDYVSHRMVERLALQRGERVLDTPCGPGVSVIDAARLVGPDGHVVGIDYAEGMLAIARERLAESGLTNVELEVGDMTQIAPGEPYDAVICVFGVFFVDDMPALVRSFRDLIRDGGRVGVAVQGEEFADPLRPFFAEAVQAVVPGFDVVQPWARTNTDSLLRAVFDGAGFASLEIAVDDDVVPLPSADDWWDFVLGSGLRRTVDAIGEEAAAEVRKRCDAFIAESGITEVASRSRYALARR